MSAIVTDANGRTAVYAIRSLARRGVQVTQCLKRSDWRRGGLMLSRLSRRTFLYPPPESDEHGFMKSIVEACKGNQVLIPVNESSIIPVSKYLDVLHRLPIEVPIPDYGTLEYALDKSKTIRLASEYGIPCPRTFAVRGTDEIRHLASKLQYPVVVKWRGELCVPFPRYRIVSSPQQLMQTYASMHRILPYPVVQEHISGPSFGVGVLFNKYHEARAIFMHKRIREYPVKGGPSAYCESVRIQRPISLALKLLSAMKWYGVAMVEFKFDVAEREFKLMEVNPRFWGSLPLAIAAGVDFPFLLFRVATEGDIESHTSYRVGLRCHLYLDLLAGFEIFKRSTRRKAFLRDFLGSFVSRGSVIGDLDLKDPMPSMSEYAFAAGSIAGLLKRQRTNAAASENT